MKWLKQIESVDDAREIECLPPGSQYALCLMKKYPANQKPTILINSKARLKRNDFRSVEETASNILRECRFKI